MHVLLDPPRLTLLQDMIWPEPGIGTEQELYVRLKGTAGLSQSARKIVTDGGRVGFDTWFNLFNLGKWVSFCGLETLFLQMAGDGRFQLTVTRAVVGESWERWTEIVTLDPDAPLTLDLSDLCGRADPACVIMADCQALGGGGLQGVSWWTADAPRRSPDLMVAITTFRREAAVIATIDRFRAWRKTSPVGARIRLTVVDNGQSVILPSADSSPDPHRPHSLDGGAIRLVPNENLGGSGGFARGLLEGMGQGASHVLFMDDDAAIHMDSIARAYQFLAYAEDPATAVAGAMISAQHRWAIWENGARFNSRCWPLHMGVDLREVEDVVDMELDTTRPVPPDFYGGWWFFAFPVDQVRHMPFPFFVRGDDVSFSLANPFRTVRLNGVVSFQESFTDKESPLNWYLDLRSHMAHHLALPHMELGRWRLLRIAVSFMARNLPRMHYETMTAINLALEDVLKGPGYFDTHADMAERRADLKALMVEEAWRPVGELPGYPVRTAAPAYWKRLVMKLTLNGHLVPFYRRLGRKITLEAERRGHIGSIWGASEIVFLSRDRTRGYRVTHSKVRALRESLRFLRNAWGLLRGYEGVLQSWRAGYSDQTSKSYWQKKLWREA